MFFEEKLIFFPSRYPRGEWERAGMHPCGDARLRVRDCYFQTEDGVKLHGWHGEIVEDDCGASSGGELEADGESEVGAQAGVESRPTLLICHGNGGSIARRFEQLGFYAAMGVNVMLFDYRGYGRSDGRPTEQGVYADARAAWRYVVEKLGARAEQVVVLGRSLGAAVAIDLVDQVDAAGLIVEAGFTSLLDMARLRYWLVPRWALRSRMDSLSRIGDVGCPILIVHGGADDVVPVSQGRALLAAAGRCTFAGGVESPRWLEIPQADHENLLAVGDAAYRDAVSRFVWDVAGVGASREADSLVSG